MTVVCGLLSVLSAPAAKGRFNHIKRRNGRRLSALSGSGGANR